MNQSLILTMWSSVHKLWTDQTEKWEGEILLHRYSVGNCEKKKKKVKKVIERENEKNKKPEI